MNVGVLEERIARNHYGSNESLFAAESGASKVVACFSGGKNDLCKNPLSPGSKERLNFLDNKPHDFSIPMVKAFVLLLILQNQPLHYPIQQNSSCQPQR